MAGQTSKSARAVAAQALSQFDPTHNYAGTILNRLLEQTHERQRTTDLVLGTTRNRTAIDTVIAKFAACPADRIPVKLLSIIRIGVYELLHSPQTAEYSIVSEAVENAKSVGTGKQTGFVNAVLRQVAKHVSNRQVSMAEANAVRTLPQTPATGCEFDADFLPDPTAQPADYFAAAFSLPRWLVADWLERYDTDLSRRICLASNRRPSIYIRPNPLRTTAQELLDRLRQADIQSQIIPQEHGVPMIMIKSPRAVTQLPGFADGLFTVQDISASQAVPTLAPQPGWTVLDLCAAPGVKTMQLAEASGDSAKVVATDIDGKRLEMVRENVTRLGIKGVEIISYRDLANRASAMAPFDAILLDVPCSNTGVLARRVEARFRVTPKILKDLVKVQAGLLVRAAEVLRPGGRVCYSTCSIQSAENDQLIRKFLRRNRHFDLESEMLSLPSAEIPDHDGGYIAVVTRTRKEP